MMKYITVLEVIDNFFGDELPDFSTLPENVIEDFGGEVRRFAENYEPPPVKDADVFPSFLGGWPSARWNTFTPLVMTSLLYSGQVLVKDLVLDWFSDEQYELPEMAPLNNVTVLARNQNGYRFPRRTSEYTLTANRYFLQQTLPAIRESRALIKSGSLILAPSKKFELENREKAEQLATMLLPSTIPNVKYFVKHFRPSDIPRADDTRGMFMVWQSANPLLVEEQIKQNVREALYYFSLEYLFAQHYGFAYTTSFPFEEHVCHNAISPAIKRMSGQGQRVYQGILNSKFPLYQGLTPQIIADIRDDESYAEFRRELYQIYATVPEGLSGSELRHYLGEAEEAMLRPALQKIERNEDGPLSRLGFSRIGVLRIAATVLAGLASGIEPVTGIEVLGEVLQNFVQRDRNKGASVIWKKLYHHGRSVKSEFADVVSRGDDSNKPYWGVPLEDGGRIALLGGIDFPFVPYESKSDNAETE